MEDNTTNSEATRCALVTGANKGIGFEISRQLAANGVTVILTARDTKKGIEAAGKLKGSGLHNVVFHQLDVKDPASIASLAEFVKSHFKKLDILVNNAGAGGLVVDSEKFGAFCHQSALSGVNDENALLLGTFRVQTYEKAEDCVQTNYYGTKRVTEALLPLLHLSNSPRIVNVSSRRGQLRSVNSEKVTAELGDVCSLTEEKIDAIMESFLMDFKKDKLKDNGWPVTSAAYKVSKAAINAYTRILARKLPHFRVNCVHPGHVKTDITYNTGEMTPEEGARAPVMLALLPDDGPSGFYFDQMEVSTF